MQVTLAWLQTQPQTSGKLPPARRVHRATLYRIFSTCCKAVDKYIRNEMIFFFLLFFPFSQTLQALVSHKSFEILLRNIGGKLHISPCQRFGFLIYLLRATG